MTVAELRDELSCYPGDYTVVQARDSEGKLASPLATHDTGNYRRINGWSGVIERDEASFNPNVHQPVLVLFPLE